MDRPVPTNQFEKGAALAGDQTPYFIIGRPEKLSFGAKSTVQCSDQLKHKIAIQFDIAQWLSDLNHDVFEEGGVRLYELFKLMKLGMSFKLKK